MKKLQMKIKAFTLAEVLIALVIIGVVSSITLPTIFANVHRQSMITALKKEASVLAQSLERYYMVNGERLVPDEFRATHTFKPEFMGYFNVLEDCGLGHDDVNTACIPNTNNGSYNGENKNAYYNYNHTSKIAMEYFDDGQFVLTDGSLIMLENNNKEIFISVDVNGYAKKPNQLGKDLFMFQVMDNGTLKPMGMTGTKYLSKNYCSSSSTSQMNGAGCTSNFIKYIK